VRKLSCPHCQQTLFVDGVVSIVTTDVVVEGEEVEVGHLYYFFEVKCPICGRKYTIEILSRSNGEQKA